jgi:hypothetical protein
MAAAIYVSAVGAADQNFGNLKARISRAINLAPGGKKQNCMQISGEPAGREHQPAL